MRIIILGNIAYTALDFNRDQVAELREGHGGVSIPLLVEILLAQKAQKHLRPPIKRSGSTNGYHFSSIIIWLPL